MRVEASGGIRVFVDIRGTVLTVCLSPEEVDGPTGALLTQVLPVRWQRHLQQVETPSPNASSSEDKEETRFRALCIRDSRAFLDLEVSVRQQVRDGDHLVVVEEGDEGNAEMILETANSTVRFAELLGDPYLSSFEEDFQLRQRSWEECLHRIEEAEGTLEEFAQSYERYGILPSSDGGVTVLEWAPNAEACALVGDFNGWEPAEGHWCQKDVFGHFSLRLPPREDGTCPIPHLSTVKLMLVVPGGERLFRISAWARYSVQDGNLPRYKGVFWNPPPEVVYKWKNDHYVAGPVDPRIYEAHVGISGPEGRVHTYNEFTENVLPRIHRLGFNVVQLMAIMEHPYYASFGYLVTNFFAPSSRCGTPEDLKRLIDAAHGLGISVYLDVVHSHASSNVEDGINNFDGSGHHFFHEGPKGLHSAWNSRLFNYSNLETLRFLLSNLQYWREEFHFDGFRFDGVTSMLYLHHGLGHAFTSMRDYFCEQVDLESLIYLKLANQLLHSGPVPSVTIAEDVSGMPALCRPNHLGGLGFDYRLGMAIPDMWIKILKEQQDEDWDLGYIVHNLTNRRYKEKVIAYCESHDQALVGDKTIAFWLMDKLMYDFMSKLSPSNLEVDRGIALHKLIRAVTYGLGGDGYLTFMGNEFGHPEWLDFPREGNNDSYHYARRRYDLADDPLLKYQYLEKWEGAMHALERRYQWLVGTRGGTLTSVAEVEPSHEYVSRKHEGDKVLVFERGPLVFIFNFHPTNSYQDYQVGVPSNIGRYLAVLSSDEEEFGGFSNVQAHGAEFWVEDSPFDGRPGSIKVYIPPRIALVLIHESDCE